MNKRTGKFLAVLVSAACVKYGMQAQNMVTANAAEQNGTEITETTAQSMGNETVDEVNEAAEVSIEAETAENNEKTETVQANNESIEDEKEELPEGMTEEEAAAGERINNGKGTTSDYAIFNISSDSYSVKLLNSAYKGRGKYAVKESTLRSAIEEAVGKAWYGLLSLGDYQRILGYTDMDQGYVDAITAKIFTAYGSDENSSKITTQQREKIIVQTLESIEQSAKHIRDGYGNYTDYGRINGSLLLSSSEYYSEYSKEVDALNGAIKGRSFDTLKSLQEEVEKVEAVYSKLKSTSEGITKDDMEVIGISGINDLNYDYLLKELTYSAPYRYYDTNKIYSYYVKYSIESLKSGYEKINNGKGISYDYNCQIGDDIVTGYNLDAINYALKGKNINDGYSLRDAVEKIIALYTDLKDRKDVSISDLYDMGFENITEDAYPVVMNYVKSTLEKNSYDMDDSDLCNVIQNSFKDCTEVFEKINNGTEEVSDFDLFQMQNYYKVDDNNIKGIALALKDKNIKYNNELYSAVNEAYDRYYRIGAGIASPSDYMAIGINNLNDMTAKFVSYKIADMNLQSGCTLTINEIADEACKLSEQIADALENINNGTASVDDFSGLEIDAVNDTNIDEVNELLKGKGCCTLESISDYLKSDGIGQVPEEKQSAYDSINAGTGTLDDYNLLGITKITAENLGDVDDYLKEKNCFNRDKMQKQVNLLVDAIEQINSGSSVIEYYNIAGISAVKNSNSSFVTNCIKDAVNSKGSNLTLSEINTVCESSLKNIESAVDILSQGNAGIDIYEAVGLTKVREYNLSDINSAVKGINSDDLVLIQNTIDSIADPLERIDNGTAAVGDYNKLSISGVNNDNLAAVNTQVKKEGQEKNHELSIAEAAAAAQNGVEKFKEIFSSILANGTATVEDYNYIGFDAINDNNIDDVNEDVCMFKRYIKTMKQLKHYSQDYANVLKLINEGTKELQYYNWSYAYYDGGIGVKYPLDESDIGYVVDAILKAREEKGRDLHKAELLQIAEEVCESDEVDGNYIRFKNGTATMEDFKNIGCDEFKEYFLSDANYISKSKAYKDVESIKNEVNQTLKILPIASRGELKWFDIPNLFGTAVYIVNREAKDLAQEKGRDVTKAELDEIVYNAKKQA